MNSITLENDSNILTNNATFSETNGEITPPETNSNLPNNDDKVLYEADTESLTHQIAGHSRTGVLKHRLGYVLKPVQKKPLGEREVGFYKQIVSKENDSNKVVQKLKPFIPGFHGVATIIGDLESKTEYLMLDDIVEGFSCPCIIDIKIGKQTWDPLATKAKAEHEQRKYTGTKNKFGISVTGMQFYDIKKRTTLKCESEWGKTLVESSMYSALYSFLNKKANAHKAIAELVVKQLKILLEIFELQTDYLFYSSSILIAYDAKHVQDYVRDDSSACILPEETCHEYWLRVRLIDFAHVFPANGSVDHNYLFGLKSIIQIFSNISKSVVQDEQEMGDSEII